MSVHPISWIPEEWPSNMDSLRHGGFAKQPPLIGPSPEVSLIQDRSDLEDDGESQTPPPQLLRFSGRKRKFVECDGDLDVARDVPFSKRMRLELHMTHSTIATEERSPEAHYRHATSVPQEERFHYITDSDLTPWPNSGCVAASCPAADVSAVSYAEIPPLENFSVSQDHSSGDASLENQSPSSSLAASSYAPIPNHAASDTRPQSPGSDAPFDPYVDNILDSSSDSSLTSDDSSCGSWAYLETLEPVSPSGAFATLRDELFQMPDLDIPNPSFILDLSSDVEIDPTRHHHLERSRLLFGGSETIFDKYKRKRLFITNEDDYEERPCKRRSIEQ